VEFEDNYVLVDTAFKEMLM